jgi:hypothetical protein
MFPTLYAMFLAVHQQSYAAFGADFTYVNTQCSSEILANYIIICKTTYHVFGIAINWFWYLTYLM